MNSKQNRFQPKQRVSMACFSVGLLAVALLSGCANLQSSHAQHESASLASVQSGLVIDAPTLGVQVVLQTSPWGANISTVIQDIYTSATAQSCLTLVPADASLLKAGGVMSSSGESTSSVLLCQTVHNRWALVRNFSR